MRCADVIDQVSGLGSSDHVCWAYDDHDEFAASARQFLADGFANGNRLVYVGPGDVEELRGHLDGLDDLMPGDNVADAVHVVSLSDTYAGDDTVDTRLQYERYTRATAESLAAGFTGLRVAADVSTLVRTPEQVDAFARWEHTIDHYMSTHPYSAMCAYDRRQVGDDTVAAMSCLHPSANTATLFRLYAIEPNQLALKGEIDATVADLLSTTLERIDIEVHGGELVLDSGELTFIDHTGLLVLSDHADRWGVTVVLRRANPCAARLLDILELGGVRAERIE
jgi:anti-anti-sigma regulatory factor